MRKAAGEREAALRAWARGRYVPRPYPGRIVLFRARDLGLGPGYRIDSLLGWRELARGGLDVHEVPGDHLGILREPHVQVLAEKLRPYLGGEGPAAGPDPSR